MPDGSFHDLWNLLQKIMPKTACSTCDLWIFSQHLDFPAKNLKITWTDKDLKGKENVKRRDRGKQLEEKESHLSKGENVENIKRDGVHRKKLLLPLYFVSCFGLPYLVFLLIKQN